MTHEPDYAGQAFPIHWHDGDAQYLHARRTPEREAMRFTSGVVTGALIVAGGTFAAMALLDPPNDLHREQHYGALMRLHQAEQERDRLRLQVLWLEAESKAWKKLAVAPEPKRVD